MADKLFLEVRKNLNVIQINIDQLIDHVAKDITHGSLEHNRCICESEWHYQILTMTTGYVEGSFQFISLSYVNQIIGVAEVEVI